MQCANHPQKEVAGACVYCGKLFCSDCLVEVDGKMYCKNDITKVLQEAKQSTTSQQPQFNTMNTNANAYGTGGMPYQPKSKILAILLCVFVGYLGIHRFYVGKIGTGVIWLFTGGLFGVGWIIDLIIIAVGGFRDKNGMFLD